MNALRALVEAVDAYVNKSSRFESDNVYQAALATALPAAKAALDTWEQECAELERELSGGKVAELDAAEREVRGRRWDCQSCGSDLGSERYCAACVKTRYVDATVHRAALDAERAKGKCQHCGEAAILCDKGIQEMSEGWVTEVEKERQKADAADARAAGLREAAAKVAERNGGAAGQYIAAAIRALPLQPPPPEAEVEEVARVIRDEAKRLPPTTDLDKGCHAIARALLAHLAQRRGAS